MRGFGPSNVFHFFSTMHPKLNELFSGSDIWNYKNQSVPVTKMWIMSNFLNSRNNSFISLCSVTRFIITVVIHIQIGFLRGNTQRIININIFPLTHRKFRYYCKTVCVLLMFVSYKMYDLIKFNNKLNGLINDTDGFRT